MRKLPQSRNGPDVNKVTSKEIGKIRSYLRTQAICVHNPRGVLHSVQYVQYRVL